LKREGEGGVERQLQELREGHGRQGEVALPRGETVKTLSDGAGEGRGTCTFLQRRGFPLQAATP
jgi:hypothetical protein